MEGSREKGLRESISSGSLFCLVSFASSQLRTRLQSDVETACSERDQRSISSQFLKHTSVSTTGFQTSSLKEVDAFPTERLLYKCYGTAAFTFNDDSS